MAAKEIYDYVSQATADNNQTLSVLPQRVLKEFGTKNQVIHLGDDGSEERISLSDDSIFYVTLQWPVLDESDAGTLMEFWHDPSYGRGRAKTFKWEHPTDGHTYVVRFDSDFSRDLQLASIFGVMEVRLKIIGYV
jgi:hypothetical protein